MPGSLRAALLVEEPAFRRSDGFHIKGFSPRTTTIGIGRIYVNSLFLNTLRINHSGSGSCRQNAFKLALNRLISGAKSYRLRTLPISHYDSRLWKEISANLMILIDRGWGGRGYPHPPS